MEMRPSVLSFTGFFGVVQEETVKEFQGKCLVKFGGVVSIPLEMTPNHSPETFLFDIRPGKGARVEQHLLDVSGQGIPVPNPEMEGFVSSQEDVFGTQGRKGMVNARLNQLVRRLAELSMVDFSKIPHDRVGLGSTVVVLDVDKDEKVRYKLVTSEDVDVATEAPPTTSKPRSCRRWPTRSCGIS